jgi:hypothetical protein
MSDHEREIPAEDMLGMVVHRIMDPGMPADEIFLLSGGKLMGEEWSATTVNGYMEIKVVKRILMPQVVKVKLSFIQGDVDG